jgi:hypothetical protein
MAISIFGTGQSYFNNTGGGTSQALNIPNGGTTITTPTLVVIAAGIRAGTPTLNTPAGFTKLNSIADGAANALFVFYQSYASGATLPSSVNITNSSGGWTFSGAVSLAYQGYNSVTPIDGAGITTTNTTGSPFTATGVTTTGANEQVVWTFFVATSGAGTSPIISKGTIEVTTGNDVAGAALMTDLNQVVAGASGSTILTYTSGSSHNMAISFAINVAAASSSGGQGNSPLGNVIFDLDSDGFPIAELQTGTDA